MIKDHLTPPAETGEEPHLPASSLEHRLCWQHAIHLWFQHNGTIPLQREGATYTIVLGDIHNHTAMIKTGPKEWETLTLSEEEAHYCQHYAYQQLLALASDLPITAPGPIPNEEAPARLPERAEPVTSHIAELEKSLEKQHAYQHQVREITSNTNMTYSDRVLWISVLNNHTEELLECKPFQPNISRLRQESGVSPDSATKFFASMAEAKAIKYANKAQQDENHNFTSVSTVIPLTNHSQANTRAATLRIKQRSETTKRRIARKLIIQPCPECGSDNLDDAYSAIVPICKNCNHVTMEQQETILARNVRIIEEETIAPNPSHEFSEVTDHEWEDNDDPEDTYLTSSIQEENTRPASHEFSEARTTNLTENTTPLTQDNNPTTGHEFSEEILSHPESQTPPSHEFSEGMTVSTPYGIGTISIISFIRNRFWCRVRLDSIQEDGTHYRPFELNQVQPLIQSSLLEERSTPDA